MEKEVNEIWHMMEYLLTSQITGRSHGQEQQGVGNSFVQIEDKYSYKDP